jgi:hypothetical protein
MEKIIQRTDESIFPYIAYIPENISSHPALLVQLHGAGERGNGGNDVEEVLVHDSWELAFCQETLNWILSQKKAQ